MSKNYILSPRLLPTPSRPDAVAPCPVCSTPSTYVASLDRFVHSDGTSNQDCWWLATVGSAQIARQAFDDWYLPASDRR